MLKTSKAIGWIVATTSAVGACVVVALIGSAPTNSTAIKRASRPLTQDSTIAVGSARQAAAAECVRRVEAWRRYLRLARSPEQLRKFVDELTGLEQKLHLALDAFRGPRLRQRVVEVFRRRVIDDRQLEVDLDTTVAAYDQFLFEQDRQFYEPAGISREQWEQTVHGGARWVIQWSGHLAPVIELAAREACKDTVRFAAAEVAGNIAANQIKKLARDTGWDTSEVGSVRDRLSDVVAQVGIGGAIDTATDATDGIVSRLSDEMARAEHGLLEGEWGLRWVLRRTEEAHERARNKLISPGTSHQE
jgi:hypothetical protein